MPARLSPREIALPPPCTTIGRMPTAFMKAMSVKMDFRSSALSMTLPPSFTTIISPLKRAM